MIESKIHFFVRRHLQTGSEWIVPFNFYHHFSFECEANHSLNRIEQVKLDLINEWNQRGADKWQYRLHLPAPCSE